ncbi:MAG: hypothetical protein V1914_02010 [archaeon]
MSLSLEYRLIDPWVIEKLKEKKKEDRPRITIVPPEPFPKKDKEKEPDRGVYKINIDGDDDSTYDMITF